MRKWKFPTTSVRIRCSSRWVALTSSELVSGAAHLVVEPATRLARYFEMDKSAQSNTLLPGPNDTIEAVNQVEGKEQRMEGINQSRF